MLFYWENISKVMAESQRAAAAGSGCSISMCLCSGTDWFRECGRENWADPGILWLHVTEIGNRIKNIFLKKTVYYLMKQDALGTVTKSSYDEVSSLSSPTCWLQPQAWDKRVVAGLGWIPRANSIQGGKGHFSHDYSFEVRDIFPESCSHMHRFLMSH